MAECKCRYIVLKANNNTVSVEMLLTSQVQCSTPRLPSRPYPVFPCTLKPRAAHDVSDNANAENEDGSKKDGGFFEEKEQRQP